LKNTATIRPILYFDGVCNLCDSTVQFILKHDKKKIFLFCTLQSEKGIKVLKEIEPTNASKGTVVLEYRGRYYLRSDAALHVLKLLGGGWKLFFCLIIVPKVIRDGVYKFISKNRYQWFGKKESCILPSEELEKRFLK
jgi:predicted DCC family thiol-disulfide oxidoreductase YuxK